MGNACWWKGTSTRKWQNNQSEPRLLCRLPVNRHPELREIRGEPYVHAVMLELSQPRAKKGKHKDTTLETTVPKEMHVHIYMVRPRLRQVSQRVQIRTKQYLTTEPSSPQTRLLQKRCVLHESMAAVKRRKTSRHQCHRRVYRRPLETGRLLQQVAVKLAELELE